MVGAGRAHWADVAGVRRFEDLIAWQLATELCDLVYDMTDSGRSLRDAHFRGQIRRASKKAPALIAEGFLRFTRPEMIRYLRMARAELGEVQDDLGFARRRQYCRPEDLDRADNLAKRAFVATTRLLKSKLRDRGSENGPEY